MADAPPQRATHPEPDLPIWVDGRLRSRAEALPHVTTNDRPGCYTTARIREGRPAREAQHIARLLRDVETLQLGRLSEASISRAFHESAKAVFGFGEGIVRLEAHAGARGEARLVAIPRFLGPDSPCWKALTANVRHAGAHAWSRVKLCSDPRLDQARGERNQTGVDEMLLVDPAGYVIEGSRTNLVVIDSSGVPLVPDLERGGVQGIAHDTLRERLPQLRHRNIAAVQLHLAKELIAINAVRGAKPIIELDGVPIGSGEPGPWASRLARILAID